MAAHSRPLLVFALAVYVGVVVMLVSSIVFKGSTATALGLRATRQLDHDTDHLIHNLSCAEIPNFCGDSVGQIVCAHFCYLEREVPRLTEDLQYETSEVVDTGERYATLNEDEPSESCQDNVGGNLHCALLTDVCTNPYASLLCPRFCGFCTSEQKSTGIKHEKADWVCADMVGTLFKTKEELCADTMGEEACAEFCR
ncbi:hypothetical protein BaRGS_00022379 [Batillaria attramentaria]|uniref:ShKT domain-containing protein n=1 Tax=Batillaria attramentaria TaxID=370345 RepID=A0ABD0KH07_9CAEN